MQSEWPYGEWPPELRKEIAAVQSEWTEEVRLIRGRVTLGRSAEEVRQDVAAIAAAKKREYQRRKQRAMEKKSIGKE